MPAKSSRRWKAVPQWVKDVDDECLKEILADAHVARDFAFEDMKKVRAQVPKSCRVAFDSGEKILDDIRYGRVHASYRCKRAAVAVRKFGEARTCARVASGDTNFVSGRDLIGRRARQPRRRV